jgi:hypothetical protein
LEFIEKIQLEFCTVSLREDGIIENRFLNDTTYEIDSHHLIEIADAITHLAKGSPKAILSIAGLYGSISAEARKVDINAANVYTLALALVIQELSQRMLANFYFKLKRIDYPVKTFKNEADAITWLQQQIRMNQMAG